MIQLLPPLKNLYMTQWYGIDLVGGGFYARFNPSGKHSGWDLRAKDGTPIYAGADGFTKAYTDRLGAKYVNLHIPWGNGRELIVHHNHCSETVNQRKVKRGEQIGLTGKTGTHAPHLHYGTRFVDTFENDKTQVVNYGNGYRGYINPAQFFPKSLFYRYGKEFKLPVDSGYGEREPKMTVLEWYKANRWIWNTYRRLMTDREMKALRWGYWDIQAILDPGMFHTWSKITKSEWLKRIGKL